MATLTSSLDLRSPASPRSLCVWTFSVLPDNINDGRRSSSSASSSSPFSNTPNPFDGASSSSFQNDTSKDNKNDNNRNRIIYHALVYGTERGSLHYRTYPAHVKTSKHQRGSVKGPGSFISPLGYDRMTMGGGGRSATGSNNVSGNASLSGALLPVDLNGAVSGPVISICRATSNSNDGNEISHSITNPIFLLLVDDNRGPSNASPGAYTCHVVALQHGSFTKLNVINLPRVSCVDYHHNAGYVFAAGSMVSSLPVNVSSVVLSHQQQEHQHSNSGMKIQAPTISYNCGLPSASRPGQNALALTCDGNVAVVAANTTFYAVPGGGFGRGKQNTRGTSINNNAIKVLSFTQPSQVFPAIVVNVTPTSHTHSSSNIAGSNKITSVLFLASGKECAILEIVYDPRHAGINGGGSISNSSRAAAVGPVTCTPPRNGIAQLPSPILATCLILSDSFSSSTLHTQHQQPYPRQRGGRENLSSRLQFRSNSEQSSPPTVTMMGVLTSDGLVQIRSISCIAIPMFTVEVGNRPNNFFALRAMPPTPSPQQQSQHRFGKLVSVSYSGDARVVACTRMDKPQDLADRLMKLSIDAFGTSGFPRKELAEALHASFSATSYVGPESSIQKRMELKQYLEATTLNAIATDGSNSDGYTSPAWNMHGLLLGEAEEENNNVMKSNIFADIDNNDELDSSNTNNGESASPLAITGVALLCLVCAHLNPPNGSLASRAAKAIATHATKIGFSFVSEANKTPVVTVVEKIVDRLLREANANSISLLGSTSSRGSSLAGSGGGGRGHHNQGGSVTSPPHRQKSNMATSIEFVESAVWLLRSCGRHDRALQVLQDRMISSQLASGSSNAAANDDYSVSSSPNASWSLIKYESYTAAHLGELWASCVEKCCNLVLYSSATKHLLEKNPELGLNIFIATHPQNERQWIDTAVAERDDPLFHSLDPMLVVQLLKSVKPCGVSQFEDMDPLSGEPFDPLGASSDKMPRTMNSRRPQQPRRGYAQTSTTNNHWETNNNTSEPLPLQSGRALAATFLESVIGISSGRPIVHDAFEDLQQDPALDERTVCLHDELAYLLLEGVIGERGGDQDDFDQDTELGHIYRMKLRRLLAWPASKYRVEHLLSSLPSSFLQEHALLLGKLGRHEDALRILYSDLHSLEMALEYCDARHAQRLKMETERTINASVDSRRGESHCSGGDGSVKSGVHLNNHATDCVYLPLVRVALESDPERGVSAAIQVLALRRGAVDSSALRLLPENVPVSAVARPFLIPAIVDSESQVRRLKVAAALLRARYVELKRNLTEAQIKSQAMLHTTPALRALNVGDLLHSSRPFLAKPSRTAAPGFPDVILSKHFFARHLIIQANITNISKAIEGRTIGDVAFVVAESSDDSIIPTVQVPLKTLPPNATGSVWCAMIASPGRLDETAFLTCELRYTILAVDATTGAPLNFGGGGGPTGSGMDYVEELQDIEIRPSEFVNGARF